MTGFLGIAAAVLFCSLLVKDKSRVFALLLSAAGGILLLFVFVKEAREVVSYVLSLADFSDSTASFVCLMLKVLALTVLTGFICDLCRDSGENALASVTELCAKAMIITLVLPLFKTVISVVSGLVK